MRHGDALRRAARARATRRRPGARASRAGAPRVSAVANASLLGGEPARAADVERLGDSCSPRAGERVARRARRARSTAGVAGRRTASGRLRPARAAELRVERAPRGRERVVVDVVGEVQHALLDRAVRQDREREHERRAGAPRAGRCGPCAASACGPTTTAAWRAHAGEQLARLVEQVLERLVRRREQRKKSATARRCAAGSAPLLGEVVDEVAVAVVGGDPPGRRVRLRRCSPRARARSCRCARWRSTRRGRATRATVCEPTGCAVSTYSSTIARRIAALRSSRSIGTRFYRVPAGARCRRSGCGRRRTPRVEPAARGGLVRGQEPARGG